MPYDLSKLLVVGVSSRALFNLEEEHAIFKSQAFAGFSRYQLEHEDETLRPGSAFALVKGLLNLNNATDRRVEVILMSRNHPNVCIRVWNSIEHYGIDITRAALSGGSALGPYLKAFKVDLFLSQSKEDVQEASNQGVAAGLVYSPPQTANAPIGPIRIAFDGDCVIFSDEAQNLYDPKDPSIFFEHEKINAKKALPDGPFAPLLRTLSKVQGEDPNTSPVRIALVTARSSPAHLRALYTLRAWGVRIDEAFFLGGISKDKVLAAFGAHMFFDDQEENCIPASGEVPVGQVLLPLRGVGPIPVEDIEITVGASPQSGIALIPGKKQFLMTCKSYLKRDYPKGETALTEWYEAEVGRWDFSAQSHFLAEFEESVNGTPIGSERRAVASKDTGISKLLKFLNELSSKHRRS